MSALMPRCLMKIAIVRRECGLGLGGAEGYCENVAKGLAKQGHQVTIVSRFSRVKSHGISCMEVPVLGRGSLLKNLSFFKGVSKVLKTDRFDCIYGLSRIEGADLLRISDPLHVVWLELGYYGCFLPKWFRSKLPRHISLVWQERRAVTTARYIVTNSNLVKKQLVHYYKINPSRITVIYNGVDLSRFSPLGPKEKRTTRQELGLPLTAPVILFAGSDPRRKGFDVLLRAIAPLTNTFRFHLAVAGFNPSGTIKRSINRLGLEKRVAFLGIRQDIERVYGACDLLCLPTSYDPFANVCLEAMACGLPIITTNQNGASELVKKVADDWVIPAQQDKPLRKAIGNWLSMDNLYKQELCRAFTKVAFKFGLDQHIKDLGRLLNRVAVCK